MTDRGTRARLAGRFTGLALATFVTVSLLARPSVAAEVRAVFPYRDADFLSLGEANGGIALVPEEVPADEPTPLVVLLHGVNMDQTMHMWFGARGFPDLAALVTQSIQSGASRPYILAAPSQTRGAASGHRMWQDFDLDDFVGAVERAIGPRARIDRNAVLVVGHSGGGCNPDGGLLRVARASSLVVPRALLAIDTCIDEETGSALGSAPASASVWVRWQTELWPRPIDRFRAAFKDAALVSGHADPLLQPVTGLAQPVHEMILLEAFTSVIPSILSLLAREEPARP